MSADAIPGGGRRKKLAVSTDEERSQRTIGILSDTVARLAEHCDNVIILASIRDSNGNTERLTSREGDDYAVYGITKAFVTAFEGQMKKNIR